MLLSGGRVGATSILSEKTAKLMTANALTPEQLRPLDQSVDFLRGQGFGLGVAVTLQSEPHRRSPGSFSWPGGYATTWFADPARELIALMMTQVWQDSLLELGPAFEDGLFIAEI
jgi:CubicO group peptidase (beta-lactamase class C family)